MNERWPAWRFLLLRSRGRRAEEPLARLFAERLDTRRIGNACLIYGFGGCGFAMLIPMLAGHLMRSDFRAYLWGEFLSILIAFPVAWWLGWTIVAPIASILRSGDGADELRFIPQSPHAFLANCLIGTTSIYWCFIHNTAAGLVLAGWLLAVSSESRAGISTLAPYGHYTIQAVGVVGVLYLGVRLGAIHSLVHGAERSRRAGRAISPGSMWTCLAAWMSVIAISSSAMNFQVGAMTDRSMYYYPQFGYWHDIASFYWIPGYIAIGAILCTVNWYLVDGFHKAMTAADDVGGFRIFKVVRGQS